MLFQGKRSGGGVQPSPFQIPITWETTSRTSLYKAKEITKSHTKKKDMYGHKQK